MRISLLLILLNRMHEKKIAIIMPARNAGLFIEKCINSILHQSYTNWELVVVNDHSTDNTLELLHKFADIDRRITVINNTGNGIIDALKMGYSNTISRFITRMDADDIMPPNKLELMVNQCGKNTVVTGKIKYISETELGEGYTYYESWLNSFVETNSYYSEIYKECVIPSPCWMMERQTFDKIGGFNSETYPEDYDLVFRMYQHNIKVKPIKTLLHIWRDHSARASRNDKNYSDNNFLELKTNYFLKIDYDSSQQLVIWGVGKKGKTLARMLIEKNIDFKWITDNPNRIGKDVYGKRIENQTTILETEEQCQ
ncbi:MAG: glycosyltransferase family 2 protein, partial [Flavobacteriales bacterium]|nr:glycosyltransferase family 2 protein [Flavobacteriales bacterium]